MTHQQLKDAINSISTAIQPASITAPSVAAVLDKLADKSKLLDDASEGHAHRIDDLNARITGAEESIDVIEGSAIPDLREDVGNVQQAIASAVANIASNTQSAAQNASAISSAQRDIELLQQGVETNTRKLNDMANVPSYLSEVAGKVNDNADDIALLITRVDAIEDSQNDVDLSEIVGSKLSLCSSEECDGTWTCAGFVPMPAHQLPLRDIYRVWLPIPFTEGVRIFACTYSMGDNQSTTIGQVTQIAQMSYNAQGQLFETELHLREGEIYGFAFPDTCPVPTLTAPGSENGATNRCINNAAESAALAIGQPTTNSGKRNVKFCHAIGRPGITAPLEENIAEMQSDIAELGVAQLDAQHTIDTYSIAFYGNKEEQFPISDADSELQCFGFVPKPSDQLPIRHITRVWLDKAEMQGCSIIALTATIDSSGQTYAANSLRCILKRPLTWNPQGWYDTDISLPDGTLYGFVIPVQQYNLKTLSDSEYFGGAFIGTLAKAQGVTEGQIFDKNNKRNAKFYHAIGNPSLFQQMQAQIDSLIPVVRSVSRINFAEKQYQSLRPHDMTWIGEQLWSFDKGSNGGELSIYDQDGSLVSSNTRCQLSQNFLPDSFTAAQKYLEFKSVDFRDGALLVGNGSSLFDAENTAQYSRAYIFYQAQNWPSLGATVSFNNCGQFATIDLSALGHKSYALWAGAGLGQMYVFTNFLKKITLVQLGLGANRFAHGSYTAADADKHNGTWAIIQQWQQDQTGSLSFHGGQAWKDKLYIATNDQSKAEVYVPILGNDGSLRFDAINMDAYGPLRLAYGGQGNTSLKYTYLDGLCIKDGKLYAHPLHTAGANMLVAEI